MMTTDHQPAGRIDDEVLLALWRDSRDERAFTQLCERHSGLVAAASRRLGSPDVDETAQVVFFVLAQRPGTIGTGCLTGWLLVTTRRVIANQRRATMHRHHYEQEAAMQRIRQNGIAHQDSWQEVRPLLDDALISLSPGRREAVVRFYLGGRSQQQIAEELHCSVDAVKNRVHKGLAQLRAQLRRRGVVMGPAALACGLATEAAPGDSRLSIVCSHVNAAAANTPRLALLATQAGMTISGKLILCAIALVPMVITWLALRAADAGTVPVPLYGVATTRATTVAPNNTVHGETPSGPPTPAYSWTPVAPTLQTCINPLIIPLRSGRVLVLDGDADVTLHYERRPHPLSPTISAGGFIVPGRNLPEAFDPVKNRWVATAPMRDALIPGTYTATLLADGKVLVAGGLIADAESLGHGTYRLDRCEIYDPINDHWSTTAAMTHPRDGHEAVLLADGRVLVVGSTLARAIVTTDCELYDPKRATWTPTASMVTPHVGDPSLLALGTGSVLAMGGGICELYDPVSATWKLTGSMIKGRTKQTATLLRDGEVLIIGGGCELYDPIAGTWKETVAPLHSSRSYEAVTLLSTGQVMAIGGFQADDTFLADCEMYDPGSHVWNTGPPLQSARCCHAATLMADGRVLVVGGMTQLDSSDGVTPIVITTSCELYGAGSGTQHGGSP